MDLALRYVRFYPGVNSHAELVTLALYKFLAVGYNVLMFSSTLKLLLVLQVL